MGESLKVSLVFLFSIVCPGIFLSFLAVQGLNSQRDALEVIRERTTDRTRILVEEVEDQVWGPVELMAAIQWESRKPPIPSTLRDLFRKAAPRNTLFSHFFYIDASGRIFYPAASGNSGLPQIRSRPADLQYAHDLTSKRGDPDLILGSYRALLSKYSNNPQIQADVHWSLGRYYLSLNDHFNALEHFRIMTDRYPTSRNYLGEQIGLKAFREMASIYRINLRNPDYHREILVRLGRVLITHHEILDRDTVTNYSKIIFDELPFNSPETKAIRRQLQENEPNVQGGVHFRNILDKALKSDLLIQARQLKPGKSRFGFRTLAGETVVYTPLPQEEGRTGVAGFRIDTTQYQAMMKLAMDRYARESGGRFLLTGPETKTLPKSADPALGMVPMLVKLELREPLKGYSIRAYPDPEKTSFIGGRDPSALFWAIGLAILAIAAGVFITVRTVYREAKASQLKSDFVSTITHELKTPLTSIGMFVETLQLGRIKNEEEVQECLEIMAKETNRLSFLIEKVLTFSKLEGKKVRFNPKLHRVDKLVDEAIEVFRSSHQVLEEEEMPIEVSHVNTKIWVVADPTAMIEILLNLLSNAYKYGGCDTFGNRRPRACYVSTKATGGKAFIEIEDNGPGIPQRERRRIFEKFYRAPDQAQREVQGSGIGLTIAKHMAEAHRGEITVTSRMGKGSKFTLTIPRVNP